MKKELLLGCGASRRKRLWKVETPDAETFQNLTTLDINPDCKPDIVHDIKNLPLPFDDNAFDEIHAYDVLEHLWTQGDYRSFFALFTEFWRILKTGGEFYGVVPDLSSEWLWGDPGHSCVITSNTVAFLSQETYKQTGTTNITDYRNIYKADYSLVSHLVSKGCFFFILRANKGGFV